MPAIKRQTETLTGELTSHRVRGADHWGTGTVRVPRQGKVRAHDVQVTGKLLGVKVGDQVELEGHWHDHPTWGRQFKVKRCSAAELAGEGVVRWMASRLPDIGEGRARELVDRFGEQLWDVIESEPDRMLDVPGITPARLAAIREAYAQHRGERDAMVKLRGWGLTDHQVGQCASAWGSLDKVLERLQADPYQLSTFVHGFGFKRADTVARKMGVPLDAPARIRAGIEFVLSEAASNGHVFVWGGALQKMAADAKVLGIAPELVGPQILALADAGRVVRRGPRVYPLKLDLAEGRAAASLKGLLDAREDAA